MSKRILLDLSDHCIQTAAKHEHARLLAVLLGDRVDDPDAAEKLQLLTEFLEQTDFGSLRADNPELRGGAPVSVLLEPADSNRIKWSITSSSLEDTNR